MKKRKAVLWITFAVIVVAGILILRNANSIKVHTQEEFLFDTRCSITVFGKDGEKAVKKAFNRASVIHYDTNFFDDASLVSQINKAPAGVPTYAGEDIIEIIKVAEEVNEASEGAFDITIAPVSHLWNIGGGRTAPPTGEEIESAVALVGMDALVIDEEALTVTKDFSTTQIDLGGIAKGYAADKAAETLREMGITSAIIDFGGNIVTIGQNPKTRNGMWRIGLQKPFSVTGEYEKTVEIAEGAVVTSGAYQRYFEYEGWIFHHILDPVTGYPVQQNFSSATVVGQSSALCDALSTAAYVLGEKKGTELAEKFGGELIVLE